MSAPVPSLQIALGDRYVVEREIGRGAVATVYCARDQKHDRQVALKVLDPELSLSLAGERFLREIKVIARLQHPHILPLFDSGETEGLFYYVMPLIAGNSLRTRLTKQRILSIEDALRIASEVASALDYAHREGVIHRDIKPENILLQDGHAVVADFGIARAISTSATTSFTQTGIVVGTPAYMSPEQAVGDRRVVHRLQVASRRPVDARCQRPLTTSFAPTSRPVTVYGSPTLAQCVTGLIADLPSDMQKRSHRWRPARTDRRRGSAARRTPHR